MRLGVIGTGRMAAVMAGAVAARPGLRVTAVLSADQERARRFVARYAVEAQAFVGMAGFAEQVDAVYIATTPDRHLRSIEAAINAGLPVLCEKPLTSNRADTDRAINLAEAAGVALVEAIWPLALPSYAAMKAHLGELRRSVSPRMTFDFSFPLSSGAPAHILDAALGGVLLDRAVYGYAAALHFLGDIEEQNVFVQRDRNGIDRSAEIFIEHSSGRSILTLSFDHLGSNRIDIATGAGLGCLGAPSLGAERTVWQACHRERSGATPGRRVEWLKSRSSLRRVNQWLGLQRYRFHSFGPSPYAPLLAEFQKVVERGASQSPLIPLSMSRTIASLVEQARAHAAPIQGAS